MSSAGTPVAAAACSGALAGVAGEVQPVAERLDVAARGDERLVHQPLARDHVGEGVHQRHVGAGLQGQVVRGLHVRRAHQIDAARIADDQLRPLAQPLLHLRREHRMPFGGIRADHHDHVRLGHRVEVLGAGGGAERLLQAVAGGRMADPGAGVHVVVAEGGAHHLLHHPHFLVGAARRRDAADGRAPMLRLHRLEALRRGRPRPLPNRLAATGRQSSRGSSARRCARGGWRSPRRSAP